ncbi:MULTISPECIES: PPOX class F420-dependent oxidoreductase [unclassified Isoptericola]|uniref:PPOX class F420-dependent oxidoreductase n=1 Tax=unclassified Isoptericola TaxID=2623355 RepID=UPI0027126159|nr:MULTISPECIES: PPOX class F420-dependent oxidoreductase [unclassified Isoptericola]MDO8145054.1 PPOX class F420-dependent oxidoreductase [Isoptericola sp. 178]MDO8148688.1 PPOX class F420-dependent oxidoreductase [Isoptericola sp. b515]
MARQIATNTTVGREELTEFLRSRHHGVLVTTRDDGRPQLSPVAFGVDPAGRVVVSTYPERAKAVNLRKRPQVSFMAQSDDFGDAWVQVDGTAEVLDMPEALEPLVEYFRAAAGKEHPDWDEYREAMKKQDKSVIRITVERWGPIATGGFPPRLADEG